MRKAQLRNFLASQLLLLLLLCPFVAQAGLEQYEPVDFETITPGNTPTGFSAAKIAPTKDAWAGKKAQAALITVEDNSIVFCFSGIAPTQSSGTGICHRIDPGQSYVIPSQSAVEKFLCIDRTAGSPAKVRATYFFER